jgi:hypothetical protein
MRIVERKPQTQWGITRQTADALATVRRAISDGKLGYDTAAIPLLEDLEEAVRAHAFRAAIFRVRLKNQGTPRKINRTTISPRRQQPPDWSEDEMDMLAALYRDPSLSVEEIAARISDRFDTERTVNSCYTKAQHLGVVRPESYGNPWMYRSRTISIVAERRRKQRQEEQHSREDLAPSGD